MTKTIMNYSNELNTDMLEELNVSLDISYNPYNLPLGSIFSMGARKNPKRNFLFVSKLIGKHIPVPPQVPRVSGVLLADLFLKEIEGFSPLNGDLLAKSLTDYSLLESAVNKINKRKIDLDKKTLFLGFAETATGLGHAMFSVFNKNASYIHTTRDVILDMESQFKFEEEHSHATSHLCYSLEDNYFEKFDRIVLVDDEVTTGKTAINLIKALNHYYPNKEYVVVAFLDWRNKEEKNHYKEIEQELGIKIESVSLIRGNITYTTEEFVFNEAKYAKLNNKEIKTRTIKLSNLNTNRKDFTTKNTKDEVVNKPYYILTGRFGINSYQQQELEKEMFKFGNLLKKEREHKNTLCVGFGEYIYIPSQIASYLGEGVHYHSITRSPIYVISKEGYPIKNVVPFDNPEDSNIKNFLYNITPNSYEEVFMFLERDINEDTKQYFANQLKDLGVKSLNFVPIY